MDLNHLYARHQISLIQAAEAADAKQRDGHETTARGIAGMIAKFQHGLGAPAASAWKLAL